MKKPTEKQCREVVKDLLTLAAEITKHLEDINKRRGYEIIIKNDKKGIGFTCTLDWDTLKQSDNLDIAEVVREAPIGENEPLSMQGAEATMIRKALERCNGDKRKAAAQLGISERTLNRKIKEYKIGRK